MTEPDSTLLLPGAEVDPVPDLASVFRVEHGHMVASLAPRLGDLDLAEDATGEALLVAAERWPVEGVPPNPGGWLTTVGSNKAIDRIRREERRQDKYAEVATMNDRIPHKTAPTGPVEDDRLRLVSRAATLRSPRRAGSRWHCGFSVA